MNKTKMKAVAAGVLLALLTLRTMYMFTVPVSYQLFALFYAYTTCVYLGAALSDSRISWLSVETLMSFVFFTFAFLGLVHSSIWLVFGYALHGIWDMLHHPRIIKTKIVRWFPPLCAAFDFIVAVFILRFY